ncbi:hypothetical protein GW17_00057544 [Ensete ventricosum]|nr:hypothetical protein GW17_00057544 [Ensete ventricosum]
MRLRTRLECVGSSPRVSGVCYDGAREFTERRSRLVERLSGEAEKLAGSCEGLEVDLLAMLIWELTEGIRKLAGNTLGDYWRKTIRLAARMPKAAGLAGVKSLFSLMVLIVIIK